MRRVRAPQPVFRRARPALPVVVLLLATGCAEAGDGTGTDPAGSVPADPCDPAALTWIYDLRPEDVSPQQPGTDIVALAGGEREQLTSDGASYEPAVSPDGGQLVFAQGQGSFQDDTGFPAFQLYTMDIDGAGARLFVAGEYDRLPAWSPDGAQVGFVRVDPRDWRGQLMVVPAAGGAPRPVPGATVSWSAGDAPPSWSPGGDRLAWVERQPPGPEHTSVIRWSGVDGAEPGSATVPGWVYERPVWTADEREFVVAVPPPDGPGETRLHQLDSDTGQLTPLGIDTEVAGLTRLPTGQLVGTARGVDDPGRASLVVVDEQAGTLRSVADLGGARTGHGVTLNPVPPDPAAGWDGC